MPAGKLIKQPRTVEEKIEYLKQKYHHPLFLALLDEKLNPAYIVKNFAVLGYYDSKCDQSTSVPQTLAHITRLPQPKLPKHSSSHQRSTSGRIAPVCFCGKNIRYEVYLYDKLKSRECLIKVGSCCVKKINSVLLRKKCKICSSLNPSRSDYCAGCRSIR